MTQELCRLTRRVIGLSYGSVEILENPFYSKGSSDQCTSWNVLPSLNCVAMGVGLGRWSASSDCC
jgi:hypothetical protein